MLVVPLPHLHRIQMSVAGTVSHSRADSWRKFMRSLTWMVHNQMPGAMSLKFRTPVNLRMQPAIDESESAVDPDFQTLKRVVVVGTSCSGKTTFAKELARKLNKKHVEIDAIYWLPDWTGRPEDDFRRLV